MKLTAEPNQTANQILINHIKSQTNYKFTDLLINKKKKIITLVFQNIKNTAWLYIYNVVGLDTDELDREYVLKALNEVLGEKKDNDSKLDPPENKKCICDINTLMGFGCRCGGK